MSPACGFPPLSLLDHLDRSVTSCGLFQEDHLARKVGHGGGSDFGELGDV